MTRKQPDPIEGAFRTERDEMRVAVLSAEMSSKEIIGW